jgi:hypothetical protein
MVLGGAIFAAGMATWSLNPVADNSSQEGMLYIGAGFIGVGAVSMIATGALLGVRKRKLREYEQEHRLGAYRVQ